MIVIKKIEFLKTDRDIYEIYYSHMMDRPESPMVFDGEFIAPEFFREIIRGIHFRRPDGEEVVVGVSKQAQEVLGLMYDVWEDQRATIDMLRSSRDKMEKKIEDQRATIDMLRSSRDKMEKKIDELGGGLFKFECSGFWGRLKYLFKGPEAILG